MVSETWLVCHTCGLNHSVRADGRCPRCHGAVAAPEVSPGEVFRPPPAVLRAASSPEGPPAGWRIAGAAFLVNGILGAASALVAKSAFGGAKTVSAVSALLAVLLGAGLIQGREGARKTALALAGIALAGGLVFSAVTQVWFLGGLIALFSFAYFLLLVGEPGSGRLAVASVILAGGVVLGAFGVVNAPFVAKQVLAGTGVIDPTPVSRVEGGDWSLDLPPDRWYGTRVVTGVAPGVSFERQFLRPDGPAHVIVVSTKVPANRGFDMDAMADAISKATRKHFDEWEVVEVAPLAGRGGTRVIHVRTQLKGEKLEMLCGLFPNPPAFYEVVVGAERGAFPRLRDELQSILESFRSAR